MFFGLNDCEMLIIHCRFI